MSEQHDEDPGRPGHGAAAAGDGFSLSGDEQGIVEDKRPPRAAVLHEVVRREGKQELIRSFAALSLSALAVGLLQRHLGGIPGAFLLESLGYPFGFIVVILAAATLAGNIVGGSLIFALISHAQLRSDTK